MLDRPPIQFVLRYVASKNGPELVRTEFRHPRLERAAEAERGQHRSGKTEIGRFPLKIGCRCLFFWCLRIAEWNAGGGAGSCPALTEPFAPFLDASIDECERDRQDWLVNIFGRDRDTRRPMVEVVFERTNSRGRLDGVPQTIRLVQQVLPASAVTVEPYHMGSGGTPDTMAHLVSACERGLREHIEKRPPKSILTVRDGRRMVERLVRDVATRQLPLDVPAIAEVREFRGDRGQLGFAAAHYDIAGNQAYVAGAYRRAQRLWLIGSRLSHDTPERRFTMLGQCLYVLRSLDDYAECATLCGEMCRIMGGSRIPAVLRARMLYLLAECHMDGGHWDAARNGYSEAVRLYAIADGCDSNTGPRQLHLWTLEAERRLAQLQGLENPLSAIKRFDELVQGISPGGSAVTIGNIRMTQLTVMLWHDWWQPALDFVGGMRWEEMMRGSRWARAMAKAAAGSLHVKHGDKEYGVTLSRQASHECQRFGLRAPVGRSGVVPPAFRPDQTLDRVGARDSLGTSVRLHGGMPRELLDMGQIIRAATSGYSR